MLGLPDGITTCLFDLDGVRTQTAKLVSASVNCEQVLVAAGIADLFEDAEAGVEAGRAGSFGLVVGVDRTGHAEALREDGADIVVHELTELLGGS